MFTRRSIALAAAVGVAALSLYVLTLAPGLIAIEDTPKFQFVGRILGTAHPPGYPFYVMVSHLFGYLPIGNLAWRINLFSAVCAALTVALLYMATVELGVAPVAGAMAALGLATGSGFWFAATIAEVYSLHGCLVTAMVVALLRWRRIKRPAWFFAAIVLFSIGLGHHTSIVTIGPAVAIFAIAVAPRFALRPRTIAAILGLFALGFSQYLFVLVRTRQGAWGEAPASNLTELFDVIRGARWAGYVAPLTLETINSRLPGILTRLTHEVSAPVMVAAVAGVVALARRDRPALALVVGSIAGVVGFSTFFAGQTDGFLQPAFVLLWLLAAVGLDAVLRLVPVSGRLAAPIAATLFAAVAVWNGARNLEARDLSHRRFEMRYFAALTEQITAHSGLLAEDFLVDRMVLYERFSEPTFEQRDLVAQVEAVPARVREYSARNYHLFAFSTSAGRLRQQGFAFDYAPWPLEYGPFTQFLLDQPPGTVVAVAVPAMRFPTALALGAVPLELIGGHTPAPSWSNLAAIGVIGRGQATQSEAQNSRTSVFAGRGLPIGGTSAVAPTDILAEAVDDQAAIRIGAREIIRSREPVVALWSPRGDLVGAFALTASGRMPMPDSPLSVHRLRGVREWTPIGGASTDLTIAAAGGHLMIRQPSASPAIIYAGRQSRGLAPRAFDVTVASGQPAVKEFAGGSAELQAALASDGWPEPRAFQSLAHVYRVELPAFAGSLDLALGGLPDVVSARWSGNGEPPAFYGIDLSGQLDRIDNATDRLHVARDHHQLFLANGWSPITADETGGFSMTTASDAELLLPCEPGACTTVDLQLWSAANGQQIGLAVNGTPLDRQPLQSGWHYYRWLVPQAALRPGMNSFVIQPGQPVRLGDALISTSGKARAD